MTGRRFRLLAGLALGSLLGLAAFLAAEAGPVVRIRATADRSRATVGDRILVHVVVVHSRDLTVSPPVPAPDAGSSLVLEPVTTPAASTGPPASPSGDAVESFAFQAQAFETGSLHIPAFHVEWRKASGETGQAQSSPFDIEIYSVLRSPQDTPADLKPPAEIPAPPFPWRMALGLATLAAALIALGIVAWRRRRRPVPAAEAPPPAPALPPHEQAYRDLERLLASGLLREGKIKEFHVELAEIVKRYLNGRFGIETLERTSEEVLEGLSRARVGAVPLGMVRDFFRDTDQVKFAKHRPPAEECRRTVDRAYRLVDQTRLAIPPTQPPGPGVPAGLTTEGAT